MKEKILSIYFLLYNLIAKNRIKAKDTTPRFIHNHLVCVLSTAILMWAYTILAYFTISDKTPAIIGLLMSLIHLFSPLLYLVTNNYFLVSNIFIGAGLIHQSSFAYFSGGIDSNIIIWFGILPMISGVIIGRKGAITWSIFTTITVCLFLGLRLSGHQFPDVITETGKIWSQSLISFGWIYLSTIIIWVYVLLNELNEEILNLKNQSIQNLVFILSHDISNPLSVIKGRLQMMKKNVAEKDLANFEKVQHATQSITQIVDNVRDLYSTELGKKDIELNKIQFEEVVEEIKKNFSDRLQYKKIYLNYYPNLQSIVLDSNKGLLTHQILGNLVSNAIKFSPEDSPINIHASQTANSTKIIIEDKGLGIPSTIKNQLFEVKSKTSRKGTSGEEGTGFGLPIVKVYVEKLGGKITLESVTIDESVENHGTKFILEFPNEKLSDDKGE